MTTARFYPKDLDAELEPQGSEGERSEPERAGGFSSAGRTLHPPNPEVPEQPQRRKFTADYKRRILAEIDSATGQGQVGAILRREGLYSSHITTWRKAREMAERIALEPKKRGPKSKPKDPVQIENTKLRRENAKLQTKLRKAELMIEIQKKVHEMLGIELPPEPTDEEVEMS
jgi:transposase-like protein